MDTLQQLNNLKQKIAETDQQRAKAEQLIKMAKDRLTEVDAQIKALGVEPAEAEKAVAQLDAQLQKELAALDEQLQAEASAYQQILSTK